MSLPDDMAEIDSIVLGEVGEEFLFGSDAKPVVGVYSQDFIERAGGENFVEGYELSFTCRIEDLPEGLERGSPVSSVKHGEFSFLRHELDESGMTVVLLGRV